MFQFLIGTLKTKGIQIHKSLPNQFQFLIGTLKTIFRAAFAVPAFMFQFLIGTLKTGRNDYHSVRRDFKFQFLIGTLKTPCLIEIIVSWS